MSTRDLWCDRAEAYLRWARTPDHDAGFWAFNMPCMVELLPPAGDLTIDVGCGEGRLGRELITRGHNVVGIEVSRTLATAALDHPVSQPVITADAADLPLRSGSADLVTASMVLMDVDDLAATVREAARVLRPQGRFCFSILHPVNTSGGFTRRDDVVAPFVITDSYFEERPRTVTMYRDGLTMTFTHAHRPLSRYAHELAAAGFLIEDLREPIVGPDVAPGNPNWERWSHLPNSLHVRAVCP